MREGPGLGELSEARDVSWPTLPSRHAARDGYVRGRRPRGVHADCAHAPGIDQRLVATCRPRLVAKYGFYSGFLVASATASPRSAARCVKIQTSPRFLPRRDRGPPRHRRDASSTAWRYELTGRFPQARAWLAIHIRPEVCAYREGPRDDPAVPGRVDHLGTPYPSAVPPAHLQPGRGQLLPRRGAPACSGSRLGWCMMFRRRGHASEEGRHRQAP